MANTTRHLLPLFFLLSASGLFAGQEPDWQRFASLRDQGRLEEALRLLDSANAGRSLRVAEERQRLLFRMHRFADAEQAGERWIRLAEELGDQAARLEALDRTAQASSSRNRYAPAADLLRRALALTERLPDPERELDLFLRLALAEASLGRFSEASAALNQAEDRWRSRQDPAQGARLTWLRGVLMWFQDHLDEALEIFADAMRQAEKAEAKVLQATIASGTAQIHIRRHDYAEAIRFQRQALELAPESADRSTYLSTLGICYFELNQFDDASEVFEEVLALADRTGDRGAEAWALGELGLVVWKAEQDAARAVDYFDRAAAMFMALKSVRNALVSVSNKAMVYRELGRWEEALRLYRQVESRTLELGRQVEPNTYKGIGQCLAGLGRVACSSTMRLFYPQFTLICQSGEA